MGLIVHTVLVDKMIGSAYKTVKEVSLHLIEIKYVVDNMEAIVQVGQTMQSLAFPGTYTVATLPIANLATRGLRVNVTDAVSPTFLGTLVGGGTVFVSALCNGTTWVVG